MVVVITILICAGANLTPPDGQCTPELAHHTLTSPMVPGLTCELRGHQVAVQSGLMQPGDVYRVVCP